MPGRHAAPAGPSFYRDLLTMLGGIAAVGIIVYLGLSALSTTDDPDTVATTVAQSTTAASLTTTTTRAISTTTTVTATSCQFIPRALLQTRDLRDIPDRLAFRSACSGVR